MRRHTFAAVAVLAPWRKKILRGLAGQGARAVPISPPPVDRRDGAPLSFEAGFWVIQVAEYGASENRAGVDRPNAALPRCPALRGVPGGPSGERLWRTHFLIAHFGDLVLILL